MARKSPYTDTLKLLYVRSGNVCAFANCTHPIFDDNGLYIAELCHVKAANEGGPRFDCKQTDEQRRSYENLLFMCHRHHKLVDSSIEYTVEILNKIKLSHESKYTEIGRALTFEMITQIQKDTDYFWNRQANRKFQFEDLKIERDFTKGIVDLFTELEEHIITIKEYCDLCAQMDSNKEISKDFKILFEMIEVDFSLFEKINYWENPFHNRIWEMHNIGRPNFFTHLSICLKQLKVRVIDELIKCDFQDINLKNIAEEWRSDYEEYFGNSYYVD